MGDRILSANGVDVSEGKRSLAEAIAPEADAEEHILLVARICDAFSDPLVGWLTDRTKSRCAAAGSLCLPPRHRAEPRVVRAPQPGLPRRAQRALPAASAACARRRCAVGRYGSWIE